jgi:hypothetical protein
MKLYEFILVGVILAVIAALVIVLVQMIHEERMGASCIREQAAYNGPTVWVCTCPGSKEQFRFNYFPKKSDFCKPPVKVKCRSNKCMSDIFSFVKEVS